MNKEALLLSIIFIPSLFTFALPVLGGISKKVRNISALLLVLAPFILSLFFIPSVLSGKIISVTKQFPLGMNFTLTADTLAVFAALVSSLVSAIIVLYSFSYISHYKNQNEYYLMVVLFLGAMMGLVYSANLIFLYIFWEITAITSWRLIGFFREKEHVLRADKAFLITFFGALVMLIGFLRLHAETGSFDLLAIKEALHTHTVSNLTISLILVGIFSKSATLPFHTWLPDAGVAPSPVTALLHAAVLVKIGVYVFARLFIYTIPLNEFLKLAVLTIAAISALVSAAAAFLETDLKRIIAYSTISQIAFIFLGFASGTAIGVAGGLLYILMHGLAKAGLFLCAGIIEQNTKTKDITKLGGLITSMPFTAISFLFCAFSVMGIPPFGGFFSKYMVMIGAVQGGNLAMALVFLAGAFLTVMYLFRMFNLVFMGEAKVQPANEGSAAMVTCVVLLAALSLAGGILVYYPNLMAQAAASQMLSPVVK